MALTPAQICNMGATLLGEGLISNTFQTQPQNKRERLCAENFHRIRIEMLRANVWNFARRRTALAPLAELPMFGYETAYQLPPDFLRLVTIGDVDMWYSRNKITYSIEQHPVAANDPLAGTVRALLINSNVFDNSAFEGSAEDTPRSLRVTYIADIQNTQQFDPHFASALGAKLFEEIGPALTEEDRRIARCTNKYEQAIADAERSDAMETPPIELEIDDWELVRL